MPKQFAFCAKKVMPERSSLKALPSGEEKRRNGLPERLNRLEAVLTGKRVRLAFRLHALLPQRKSPAAIMIAVALLLITTAIKPLADNLAGGALPPFIFYYPMVVIAALVAGARVSMLMALASSLIAWFWFMPPHFSFVVGPGVEIVSIEIYAASSVCLALAVGFARYTLDLAVASEELRDYDAREAVHRIKNLLAVVQAIVLGTLRDGSIREEQEQLLLHRLHRLSDAQDILRQSGDAPASADELVQAALGPFLPSPKISISCEHDARVPGRYVHGLTLALFELATNSAKHGALGEHDGTVALDCRSTGEEGVLHWRETSAAEPADEPAEIGDGFGTKLIKVALRREKGTEVTHDKGPDGVIVTFRWPC